MKPIPFPKSSRKPRQQENPPLKPNKFQSVSAAESILADIRIVRTALENLQRKVLALTPKPKQSYKPPKSLIWDPIRKKMRPRKGPVDTLIGY
jgi:hypothetical protein